MIEDVRPYNGCNHEGPYHFRFSPDPIRYSQTTFLKINGSMRLTKANKDPITDDKAAVTPLDFYGQAWINKIAVFVNNQQISDGGGYNYHLKVLTNTLINYDEGSAKGHLRASGFNNVIMPRAADADETDSKWEGFKHSTPMKATAKLFEKSAWVEFCSDVQVDLFRTPRDFPNGMDIELRVYRNSNEYFLLKDKKEAADPAIDADNYSYEIKDLRMQMRKIQP
jgi:hypothetical protein